MVDGVYAAVNEIAVFGSIAEEENRLKSAMTAKSNPVESIGFDQKTTGFRIIQNPVQNNLRILLTEEMASDFTVDIFNLQGVKILSKHVYESLRSMEFNISLPSMNMANGVYIVNYSNFNGIKKTLKFLKTN